jgi:hypothetical protein
VLVGKRASRAEVVEELTTEPWMRYAGVLDSGDPDASSTIDEVVYGRERP